MQVENLTKEQFIRDFKDTLHHEQLIKVAKATPTEIFTALAGLVRKYYTDTWTNQVADQLGYNSGHRKSICFLKNCKLAVRCTG